MLLVPKLAQSVNALYSRYYDVERKVPSLNAASDIVIPRGLLTNASIGRGHLGLGGRPCVMKPPVGACHSSVGHIVWYIEGLREPPFGNQITLKPGPGL